MLFSNYFYGSYKINSKELDTNLYKLNFKIVTAGIDLSEFKNQKLVLSKLILMSEPNKDQKTIFVWPEGVILDENFKNTKELKKMIKDNFSEKHLIILGVLHLQLNFLVIMQYLKESQLFVYDGFPKLQYPN